jgi:hypothetical protein
MNLVSVRAPLVCAAGASVVVDVLEGPASTALIQP